MFIRVDDWEPSTEEQIVSIDGPIYNIDYKKAFGPKIGNNIPAKAGVFIIRRDAYRTIMRGRMDKPEDERYQGGVHYINYFMKFYDEDNELAVSHVYLKNKIEQNNGKIPTEEEMTKYIYESMFSPSMVDKIYRMSEDNWYIEPVEKKNRGKFREQLVFTKEHSIRMMCISIGIKFMIPIISHYVNIGGLPQDESTKYYLGLFDIFSGDIDLYNKLWITARSRVQRANNGADRGIWDKQQADGKEQESQIYEYVYNLIIRDTIGRYVFKFNWIHFNSVVIESQLRYFAKNDLSVSIIEVDNRKSPDGLSEVDKLEMNNYKLDESLPVLSTLNTQQIIKRLTKNVDIEDEVAYYMRHHSMSKPQTSLVYYYYVDMFGGYRDLHTINREKYIKLMVVLKHRLINDGFEILPQIISGNMVSHNKRVYRNKKFLEKIGGSSMYKDLMNNKFSSLKELGKEDYLFSELSSLLRSKYTYVDYNNPDILGEEIEAVENLLSAEYLSFLMMA